MSSYKKIGITVKSGLSGKSEAVQKVVRILSSMDVDVFLDPQRTNELSCATDFPCFDSECNVDLLIVLGGDGTILRTIRELQNFDTPLLSINRGTVGFLSELHLDEVEDMLPKLLNGDGILDARNLLFVQAVRGEKILIEGCALNEAVIAQGTIARLVELNTTVNGEPLTMFHADGLILATPTGSTAYSLSAGGPIAHPTLEATILTPINPHSFTQKPVVIRGDALVEVEVLTKENKFEDTEVVLTLDGQVYVPLQRGDIIRAQMDERTIKFVRARQDTFFGTLREKLKWGEGVES